MAKKKQTKQISIEETLWDSANKLRGWFGCCTSYKSTMP